MRPLTDSTPKPLLLAGNQRLIEYPLNKIKSAGYESVVINTHYLSGQIHDALGNGERYGIPIQYSNEYPDVLETGGGIFRALPLLKSEHHRAEDQAPFLVVNGDVWCDHSLVTPQIPPDSHAHLLMVKNPKHNPGGDFSLTGNRLGNKENTGPRYTFSGIGWYRPELFNGCEGGAFPLAPLLRQAMEKGLVSGEIHSGEWMDIGTPERLKSLSQRLQQQRPGQAAES